MGKKDALLDFSFHQMKHPALGIGYIRLNCWKKESHGNP